MQSFCQNPSKSPKSDQMNCKSVQVKDRCKILCNDSGILRKSIWSNLIFIQTQYIGLSGQPSQTVQFDEQIQNGEGDVADRMLQSQ